MKDKAMYRCEMCGTVYPGWKGLLKCEASHIKQTMLPPTVNAKLDYSRDKKYPNFVEITFDDGTECRYRLFEAHDYNGKEVWQ